MANTYGEKKSLWSLFLSQTCTAQSMLPLPMISRGCLERAITDAASDTAERSAVLMGGGGQHSTYLEVKQNKWLLKKFKTRNVEK